jgi:CheY-like chemotaxis protein
MTTTTDKSTSILIIEDSQVQALRLQLILEENGYAVHWTESGQAGLEAARTQNFDLIVLDVELPDMSGFQVCRNFKSDPTLGDIPIIMLTKHDRAQDAMAGLETGAIDYIPKDVFADAVLLETIKQMDLS